MKKTTLLITFVVFAVSILFLGGSSEGGFWGNLLKTKKQNQDLSIRKDGVELTTCFDKAPTNQSLLTLYSLVREADGKYEIFGLQSNSGAVYPSSVVQNSMISPYPAMRGNLITSNGLESLEQRVEYRIEIVDGEECPSFAELRLQVINLLPSRPRGSAGVSPIRTMRASPNLIDGPVDECFYYFPINRSDYDVVTSFGSGSGQKRFSIIGEACASNQEPYGHIYNNKFDLWVDVSYPGETSPLPLVFGSDESLWHTWGGVFFEGGIQIPWTGFLPERVSP